jgi:hypothetical protein
MRIDIDSYKLNKWFVRQWWEKNKREYTPGKAVSTLAVSTMVPCVVIAYWIGELTEWPPEMVVHVKTLMDFYGYTKILNKPPGSPI